MGFYTRNHHSFVAFVVIVITTIIIISALRFEEIYVPIGRKLPKTAQRLYRKIGKQLPFLQDSGEHCQALDFADPPLPITILASLPGSGSVWLRHLLQEATGILTGSFKSKLQIPKDFPAEGVKDGSVIVVDVHLYRNLLRTKNCSRVILLMRNPYRTAMAELNQWMARGNDTPSPLQDIFGKPGEWQISNNYPRRWFVMTDEWLRWTGPMLIIHYEDLLKNTTFEMKKILNFLDFKVNKENFQCMVHNSKRDLYHQETIIGTGIFESSEGIVDRLKTYVDVINQKLRERFGVQVDSTKPF